MQPFIVLKNPILSRACLGLALAATTVFTAIAQQPEPAPAVPLQPDAGNLRAFIELVRSDIQTEKATIIAQNIPFTEDEAFEFQLENQLNAALNLRVAASLPLIK